MRRLGFILLLVAGCFPDLGEGRIACGAGGSCPSDYVCRADHHCYSPSYPFTDHGDLSATTGDLAGSGGAGGNPDLAGTAGRDLAGSGGAGGGDMALPTAGCGPTVSRVCTDSSHSAVCMLQGGTWLAFPDRTCPPSSSCSMGYCDPPAASAGVVCPTTAYCMMTGGQVCNQYANTGTLTGHCTMVFPGSGGNNPCTAAGYNGKCATGICTQTANGFGCLEPCSLSSDCKMGKMCRAVTAPTTIEGVSTSGLKTCQ